MFLKFKFARKQFLVETSRFGSVATFDLEHRFPQTFLLDRPTLDLRLFERKIGKATFVDLLRANNHNLNSGFPISGVG